MSIFIFTNKILFHINLEIFDCFKIILLILKDIMEQLKLLTQMNTSNKYFYIDT